MSSLFDLTSEYKTVLGYIENEEYDSDMLENLLNNIELDINTKVDNYANLIKNIDGNIDVIEKEIERLSSRKKTLDSSKKSLKNNLLNSLKLMGKDKVKTELNQASIRKNKKVIIENINALDKAFKTVEVETKADKIAIGKLLKAGEKVVGARLEDSESLNIR